MYIYIVSIVILLNWPFLARTLAASHVAELLAVQLAAVVHIETTKGVLHLCHLIGQAVGHPFLRTPTKIP